jgi:3-oxoacyl-[acyl-carrier-protein] synthase-3
MNGNQLFKYAMEFVPQTIKDSMDKDDIALNQVSKLLFHQANAKMDYGFLGRLAELFGYTKDELPPDLVPKKKDYGIIGKIIAQHGVRDISPNIMPMTIEEFGNSSVATLPTMYDLLVKGKLPGHSVKGGDTILMASIGAGMNINFMHYKMR